MPEQLSLFEGATAPVPQSVREVTAYIRRLLTQDTALQDVWVQGELSNVKRAASGHFYFTMKDAESQLKCVMWRSSASGLTFDPQHGDLVTAKGKIDLYEPQGTYQLYAETLHPVGMGDLNRQYETLKAKLDSEGLFAPDRKQPLPTFPRKIGIVSSPTAAGFQDMLNILGRRFPMAEVILSPTLVQGTAAPPRIIAALDKLNQRSDIDVIIIARGGGSLEDLWCFNDERVVRAVAATAVPTITGVGHEIDFTLVDFVADLRAPTPSAAAEMAVPNRVDLLYALQDIDQRMRAIISDRMTTVQREVDSLRRTLRLLTPQNRLRQRRQQVDELAAQLNGLAQTRHERTQNRLDLLASRLQSADPQAILRRGYAKVSQQGHSITHTDQINVGDTLTVQLQDGTLTTTVTQKQKDIP